MHWLQEGSSLPSGGRPHAILRSRQNKHAKFCFFCSDPPLFIMIVFNTPWFRLLGDNVRDRRDSVEDERVEELGDETCFRRDNCGDGSSVLTCGGVHASKGIDTLDGVGVHNSVVESSFSDLLACRSGAVVGLGGLVSLVVVEVDIDIDGADDPDVFDCRMEFRVL